MSLLLLLLEEEEEEGLVEEEEEGGGGAAAVGERFGGIFVFLCFWGEGFVWWRRGGGESWFLEVCQELV